MKPQGDQREARKVFSDVIRREVPRVLSLMDRDALSPTAGCLDRTYWAWKFTDFPGARFQEGLYFLSFVWATPFEGNTYHRHSALLDWIACGFDFWTEIQHRGGDFDEAYPQEHSLAATAFTTFYLAEAYALVDGFLPAKTAERFKSSVERAGAWLIRNDERHGVLSNHLAAAATALYQVYRITDKKDFEERSRYFLDRILAHQSAEGWYEEYGGADPGYQTHGSFYLARYLELSLEARLRDSLERSFEFLAHFVHLDGSLGGEYGSRNTQTYYPAAFEMMSATSPTAHWIAATMLPSVTSLDAVGLGSVDIYNYFPLLNNYTFAYLASLRENHRSTIPRAPRLEGGMLHFSDAGIIKLRNEAYELYVSPSKGGVLKAFDCRHRRLAANDCGYVGRTKGGKWISSQWLDKSRKVRITPGELVIEGSFYAFDRPVFRPLRFVGFRLFSLVFGRVSRIAYWLKALLVRILIYRKRRLDLRITRRIVLHPTRFTVSDWIQGPGGERLEVLRWMDTFTTIHMGSSRYFIPNELSSIAHISGSGATGLDVSQLGRGLLVERTVSFD